MEQVTLLKRLTETYRKPGQVATEFMREVKALTPDDRVWFINEFNKAGMPCVDRAPEIVPAAAK